MSAGRPEREQGPVASPEPVRCGAPLATARVAAVVVHGRGQDAEHMREALVRRLGFDDVAYLLPEGPRVPDGPGRSWYAGRFDAPPAELEPMLSAALRSIDRAVAAAVAARPGFGVILVGFSQGGCLVAEHLARRGAAGLRGAAILTGATIGARRAPDEARTIELRLDGLPVAMVSSRADAWVGPAYVEATARALTAAGAAVRLCLTDEPEHRIDDVAVDAVTSLLSPTEESYA